MLLQVLFLRKADGRGWGQIQCCLFGSRCARHWKYRGSLWSYRLWLCHHNLRKCVSAYKWSYALCTSPSLWSSSGCSEGSFVLVRSSLILIDLKLIHHSILPRASFAHPFLQHLTFRVSCEQPLIVLAQFISLEYHTPFYKDSNVHLWRPAPYT